MSVKLSGTLPGGDRSGLDVLQGELVRDPAKLQYAIVMLDCARTLVSHGSEGETYTPAARIVQVEAVLDEDVKQIVGEILGSIHAQRVGAGTMAFDLGLADLRGEGATS